MTRLRENTFGFGLSIDPFTLRCTAWLAVGAAVVSLDRVTIAGLIVGRREGLSGAGSLNTGFTLLACGEFSIIIVNLALAGGLMSIMQPFAALYVLILASLSPLLAKESERIYELAVRFFPKSNESEPEESEETASNDLRLIYWATTTNAGRRSLSCQK